MTPFVLASIRQGSVRPAVSRTAIIKALAWAALFVGGSLALAGRADVAAHLAASAHSTDLIYAYSIRGLEFFAFVCIWMIASPVPLPKDLAGVARWVKTQARR